MNAPLPHAAMPATMPAATIAAPRTRRASALPAGVTRREIALALLAIVALHVIVITALVRAGIIETPQVVHIIQAALVRPPVPEEVKPPTEPPKPPQPRREAKPAPQPPKPVPVLAAAATPTEVPQAVVPPPDPKPELPPISAPPAPPVAAAPPAPPPPLAPPRFDADYLDNPKPPYPPLSRRMGEQGRVVLRVHVTPDGAAGEVLLATSSGSPRLDESALATVRRWKFVPARRGTEAVAAWVLVPIAFTLKE